MFQTLIIWKDRQVQMQFMELDGLTASYLNAHPGAAKYDLSLYLTDAGDEIWLEMEYCTDLFDAETIERMGMHFQTLLEGIVANPEERLDSLPLLTAAERHQLLVKWNDTRADYPTNSCVHQLFEAQARQMRDKVAVVCEDRRYTYSELNERADRLARHLRTLGVGPDVLVGLFLERSLKMVVGVLGILKAGGAYLPIDPVYPAERLSFMLEDARPRVILTQQRLAADLPPHAASVICLDAPGWQTGAGLRDSHDYGNSNEKLCRAPDPNSLAYVLYTSGSTGRPKGVQVSQRAVVNLLTSMRREPGLTAEDTLLSVTTLAFDMATLELFLPLTTGACVVIAPGDVVADGQRLAQLLGESGASVMQATPATWRMLLEAGWQGNSRLKVLSGGEPLTRDLADRLLPRCAALWNLYGPTETTVYSTGGRVSLDQPIVIGRPIANTRCYVLDRLLQPVPVGVTGELFIGGDGVARGYLNRPELTAERFIEDSFRPDTTACLYRTGDLVRYRTDGCLEYLGRLDHQVKIRGYRIELGEIETMLRRHPSVQEAVVVVREDRPGDKHLAAYVVPAGGTATLPSKLRAFLKQHLPEFMIPGVFVVLDALPLTPNGKVDRKALPKPGETWPETSSFIAPRTPIEEILAGIWAEVLGSKRVGVADNFLNSAGTRYGRSELLHECMMCSGWR